MFLKEEMKEAWAIVENSSISWYYSPSRRCGTMKQFLKSWSSTRNTTTYSFLEWDRDDFFLHHLVPGINAEPLYWRFSRSCSLPREGYAVVTNRDSWQDLRFLRDAREIRKTATIGLCACLSSVIVQSFARRRASRAGARAHPCARVFSHEYVFLLVFFELR